MDYFTVGDIANQGFYPIPEKLFNNKHYQKRVKKIKKIKERGFMVPKEIITVEELLSDTSKIVYGVMCRYLNYSLQNGWFDQDKRVFIKLSVTTLAEMLNKSRDTIIKCKKQLETVGLLKIIKEQHQSDTFYLGKVKDRSQDDIILELENRIKSQKEPSQILEVEIIDQSKPSDVVVETIDSEVVETIDPIRVLTIKDSNRETTTSSSSSENTSVVQTLEHLDYKTSPGTIKNLEKLNPSAERLSQVVEYARKNNKGPGFIVEAVKNNYQLNTYTAQHEKLSPAAARNKIKMWTNYVINEYENGICSDPLKRFDSRAADYWEHNTIFVEYRNKFLSYLGLPL